MGVHNVLVNIHEVQEKIAGDYDGGSGAHDAHPLGDVSQAAGRAPQVPLPIMPRQQ
ncbi:hypothetical protein DPMN_025070 [Dreissena polymorpha]|uniref:Uncharacterized protein n=1 Tax=Dreissena polymorpha TaxID=45954 RepID=A0A9D4LQU1_DREPO|nr:hypothetical protein DPMN_025070 [Dreissena polymorpha]